jgi:hypothetical protein
MMKAGENSPFISFERRAVQAVADKLLKEFQGLGELHESHD